jgi:hypothetical protein
VLSAVLDSRTRGSVPFTVITAILDATGAEAHKFQCDRPEPSHWIPLHRYPVQHWHSWDAQAATSWFSSWRSRIPSYGCACQKNFSDYCQSNPPDFSSADSFFQWTVEAHNFVSLDHVQPPKPTMTLVEACQLYGIRAE